MRIFTLFSSRRRFPTSVPAPKLHPLPMIESPTYERWDTFERSMMIVFFSSTAFPILHLFPMDVKPLIKALGPTVQFSPIYTGPSTYVPDFMREFLPRIRGPLT